MKAAPKIEKDGTTKTRKAFFDSIADLVSASRKIAGKNISVNEQIGYGSIISVNPQRGSGSGSGSGSGCSGGFTVIVDIHATGSDTSCPTLDLTDSFSVVTPGNFDVRRRCIGGCSTGFESAVSYQGSVSCSDNSFSMTFVGGTGHGNGISICCGDDSQSCDPDSGLFSCSCYSVSAIPDVLGITEPGVYHFHYDFTSPVRSLDVTITITFP